MTEPIQSAISFGYDRTGTWAWLIRRPCRYQTVLTVHRLFRRDRHGYQTVLTVVIAKDGRHHCGAFLEFRPLVRDFQAAWYAGWHRGGFRAVHCHGLLTVGRQTGYNQMTRKKLASGARLRGARMSCPRS